MIDIGLKITALSPILLSDGPPSGNLVESLDFIPGNTIRGVLAHRFIEQNNDPENPVFKRMFWSDETRFEFAFIKGCQMIPFSAMSCKYFDGFNLDNGHGIIDQLLKSDSAGYCCKLIGDKRCAHPLDRFEGFYNPSEYQRIKVQKKIITRTAIDPKRGSAAHGQLYSHRVIEAGQEFYANIEVADSLKADFENLLRESFTAGIGTARSRGQGWASIEMQAPLKFPFQQSAQQRLARFGGDKLAVTLLSDAIVQDAYLRDRASLLSSDLTGLGISPEDWENSPQNAFSRTRKVFGFDGYPLRLPRTPRIAINAGSVFVFKLKKDCAPRIPAGNGLGWIGENNREGYGKAILWHPFHLEPDKEVVQ